MRKLALVLIATGGLLSACVAYEVPSRDARYSGDGRYYGDSRYYGDGRYYGDRDRDGDGVPNRQDRRPDDPRRY